MCYFNGIKVSRSEYIRLLGLVRIASQYDLLSAPLLQGHDHGLYPVLKPVGEQEFDIVKMEWGFLPSNLPDREAILKFRKGYKDANGKFITGYDTLNAKAENLFTNDQGRPSLYRHAAINGRILVLSSGFYEWRHIYRKNKRTGELLKTPDKYPYYINLPDKEYFYMAGIYNPWKAQDGTGENSETFALITTKANLLMEQVHNSKKRMPTILNEELAYEWLFGKLDQARITEIAKTQYPWQEMLATPIAKDFKLALDPTAPFQYEPEILPQLEFIDVA